MTVTKMWIVLFNLIDWVFATLQFNYFYLLITSLSFFWDLFLLWPHSHYCSDNEQTSWGTFLTHAHTRTLQTKSPPKPKDKFVPANARRHIPARAESCQLKTYALNTCKHIQRISPLPHAVTGRQASSVLGPLGELEDLTSSCTNSLVMCGSVRNRDIMSPCFGALIKT